MQMQKHKLKMVMVLLSGLVSAAFLCGVVGFVSLLFPLTKPLMYNDRINDCTCWFGYCLWNWTHLRVYYVFKCPLIMSFRTFLDTIYDLFLQANVSWYFDSLCNFTLVSIVFVIKTMEILNVSKICVANCPIFFRY